MSNAQPFRSLVDPADGSPGGTTTVPGVTTTTVVRTDDTPVVEDNPELHTQLRAQVKEARLRSNSAG